jgi:hypothetical protein
VRVRQVPRCASFWRKLCAAVRLSHARQTIGLSVGPCPRIAVGMPITGHPRTDPDMPTSSIRLLPWVFDGEALLRPGMKDTWRGKPAVGQFRHPIPREAVLLAAAPERSTPEVGHVMPERRERPTICGYRIVSEMAGNDLLQPVTLIRDSLVHSPPQHKERRSGCFSPTVAGLRRGPGANADGRRLSRLTRRVPRSGG